MIIYKNKYDAGSPFEFFITKKRAETAFRDWSLSLPRGVSVNGAYCAKAYQFERMPENKRGLVEWLNQHLGKEPL